jgi:hypothetical protein
MNRPRINCTTCSEWDDELIACEARAIRAEKRAELAEGLIEKVDHEILHMLAAGAEYSGLWEMRVEGLQVMIARYKAALSAPTEAGGRKDDE